MISSYLTIFHLLKRTLLKDDCFLWSKAGCEKLLPNLNCLTSLFSRELTEVGTVYPHEGPQTVPKYNNQAVT